MEDKKLEKIQKEVEKILNDPSINNLSQEHLITIIDKLSHIVEQSEIDIIALKNQIE